MFCKHGENNPKTLPSTSTCTTTSFVVNGAGGGAGHGGNQGAVNELSERQPPGLQAARAEKQQERQTHGANSLAVKLGFPQTPRCHHCALLQFLGDLLFLSLGGRVAVSLPTHEIQAPGMAASITRDVKLLFLILKSMHFNLMNVFWPHVYGKEIAKK